MGTERIRRKKKGGKTDQEKEVEKVAGMSRIFSQPDV